MIHIPAAPYLMYVSIIRIQRMIRNILNIQPNIVDGQEIFMNITEMAYMRILVRI